MMAQGKFSRYFLYLRVIIHKGGFIFIIEFLRGFGKVANPELEPATKS